MVSVTSEGPNRGNTFQTHCLVEQVYGPDGLGKLSAGGHPRHLSQITEAQPKVQTGVNDAPTLQQQQHQQQQQVLSQNKAVQGGAAQHQLNQEQRSQEQHSQQQVKEQFSDGAKGGDGQAQQDCFAAFNPPTVPEYQEVSFASKSSVPKFSVCKSPYCARASRGEVSAQTSTIFLCLSPPTMHGYKRVRFVHKYFVSVHICPGTSIIVLLKKFTPFAA